MADTRNFIPYYNFNDIPYDDLKILNIKEYVIDYHCEKIGDNKYLLLWKQNENKTIHCEDGVNILDSNDEEVKKLESSENKFVLKFDPEKKFQKFITITTDSFSYILRLEEYEIETITPKKCNMFVRFFKTIFRKN